MNRRPKPWPRLGVNVDGRIDQHGIKYLGDATQQDNGTWRCLAIVPWAGLCIVEVNLTFPEAE